MKCRGTPYQDFSKARMVKELESMRKAAVAELGFLESLKKEEVRGR